MTGMLGKNRNAGWTEQFVRYKKYLLFRGFLFDGIYFYWEKNGYIKNIIDSWRDSDADCTLFCRRPFHCRRQGGQSGACGPGKAGGRSEAWDCRVGCVSVRYGRL